jgi:capsular exopolysaccharide synthesis family protein
MEYTDNQPTLRDFLYILFKYKFAILTLVFSSLFAAIIYAYAYLPKYQATSKILVKIGRESASPETGVVKPSGMLTTVKPSEIINTEIELLRGRQIAEGVFRSLGQEILCPPQATSRSVWEKIKTYTKNKLSILSDYGNEILCSLGLKKRLSPAEKAVLYIMNGLTVEHIKDSNAVKISFITSERSEIAARIVNEAVSLYMKQRVSVHSSSSALDFFSRQVNHFKNNLEVAEDELRQFKETYNISSLEEQRSHLLELNAGLKREIDKTEVELARLQQKVTSVESLLAENSLKASDTEITNPSQVVDYVKLKLIDLKLKRADLWLKYFDHTPPMESIDEQIEAIEKELTKEQIRSSVVSDIEALISKIERSKSLLAASNLELNELNELDHRLRTLNRNVEETEDLYKTYFKKMEEMRILQALDMASITDVKVINTGYPPLLPVRTIGFVPQRIFCIAMSFVIGLFMSISVIGLQEIFNHSIKSSDDAEAHLNLPVLGTIPDSQHLAVRPSFFRGGEGGDYLGLRSILSFGDRFRASPSRTEPQGLPKRATQHRFKNWSSLPDHVTMGFKKLKNNLLLFCGDIGDSTSIAIASSVHGEGSSVMSANLALAIADEADSSVLLMDLNFRSHSPYYLRHNVKGLSDVFLGSSEPQSVISKTNVENLHLMPCGAAECDLSNIVALRQFSNLIDALKKEYRFIIIDSPPLQNYPESTLLASKVDGVIIVVQAEKTRREVLIDTKKKLESAEASILGVVLNRRKHYIPRWIYTQL